MKSRIQGDENPSQNKGDFNGADSIKKIGGIDVDQVRSKFPSFRFSEEIYFMINMFDKKLRGLKDKDFVANREEVISQ